MRQTLKTPIFLPAALVLAQDFAEPLGAFLGEHRCCGEIDGNVTETMDAAYVRVSCSRCGATVRRRFPVEHGQRSEE